MTPDYCVRLMDLPPHMHGFVTVDEDDYASIYLNAHDNIEEQRRTLLHELRHLRRGDMYSFSPINNVEAII